MDKLQAQISLLDPGTCGEDLTHLASRMAELAPDLCDGCAEYHVRFAVTRYAAPGKSIVVDRPILIKRVQQILADQALRSNETIEIVIAGAADTGILATCAHAAAAMDHPLHLRCRFTVLDRCRSPLALCAEFADRHGLRLRTVQADLSPGAEQYAADLIISHSFFRFLDRPQQIALVKRFDTWLKPGGRIVVSQSIRHKSRDHFDKESELSQFRLSAANAAIADGAITIGDGTALLLRKMHVSGKAYKQQPGEIASADELRALMRGAGLREYSLDLISKEIPLAADKKLARIRAVVVFGSSLHD